MTNINLLNSPNFNQSAMERTDIGSKPQAQAMVDQTIVDADRKYTISYVH